MKTSLILFFAVFNINFLFSQEDENTWIKFEDEKTYLIGYKDLKGKVKIVPKFTFITNAEVFKNIIPVFEEMNPKDPGNSKIKQYYLLKDGRQIGLDSLYVYDSTLDCENENKIRFWDYKTDKVGFFDSNGKIVIPAVYDDAKPFYNGFSVVITEGKRMCWNGTGEFSQKNPCEMWSWKGNIQIINDKNEVLIENIPFEKLEALDWFSVKKDSTEINENYIGFKGVKGDYYYFLNYEKEFENWYCNEFLKDISQKALLRFLSDEVHFDVNEILEDKYHIMHKDSSWKEEKKETFLENNKTYFLKIINLFKNGNTFITEGTSPLLIRYENKPEYFSNCGDYQNLKFPYFQVHLLDKKEKSIKTLGFIKRNNHFELLEIY